ncbi:hypothetical protein [Vagococcus elongatus]
MTFVTPKSIQLAVENNHLTTNEEGIVIIRGETNPDATLKIEGKNVTLSKDGTFKYKVSLSLPKEHSVNLISRFGKKELKEKVTISPSSEFKKAIALKEEKERQRKLELERESQKYEEAKASVILAENEPTNENYDYAYLLVNQLKKNDNDLEARLEKVKETIAFEQKVSETTLAAENALGVAEQNKTRENYEKAAAAVKEIPVDHTAFENRLETINQQIIAQEQQEAVSNTPEPPNTSIVLVTPTGKKYHRRACGNGTYTEATLEDALNRGLTPCAKCF